jgi:transcriptional regulator with XRE-family HTH domain
MTADEFKALCAKLGLKVGELAETLGKQRSSISRYRKGKLPIPKSVELALKAIESEKSLNNKITLVVNTSESLKNIGYREIGDQIQTTRINKKKSQGALAKFAGISTSFVSDVENGKIELKLSTIQKIAEFLEITIEIKFVYQKPE